MHSFTRHRHKEPGEEPEQETKGLVLNNGWRYDPGERFHETFKSEGMMKG